MNRDYFNMAADLSKKGKNEDVVEISKILDCYATIGLRNYQAAVFLVLSTADVEEAYRVLCDMMWNNKCKLESVSWESNFKLRVTLSGDDTFDFYIVSTRNLYFANVARNLEVGYKRIVAFDKLEDEFTEILSIFLDRKEFERRKIEERAYFQSLADDIVE